MPDQIKKHTTVIITRQTFEGMFPCAAGFNNALPFLPAKLSTDPHKNLKLADRWVHSARSWDLWWLIEKLNVRIEDVTMDEYAWVLNDSGFESKVWIDYTRDAWVIAQVMAQLADQLATMEGR